MNIWDSIKKVISGVAPILGNAIVPGVGGIAGSLLAQVLNVENTPEALEQRIQNLTAEDVVKIKEVEAKHQERLLEIGVESDRVYLQDIQDARKREAEVVKATGKKDINLYVLAWTVVASFFLIVALLLYKAIPVGQDNIVYMLLGTLGTGFITVLSYFFGSSKGSADKTTLLAGKK